MNKLSALLLSLLLLSGCANRPASKYEEIAHFHDKKRDYYASIGEPHVAEEHRKLAEEARKKSLSDRAFAEDIFSMLFGDK